MSKRAKGKMKLWRKPGKGRHFRHQWSVAGSIVNSPLMASLFVRVGLLKPSELV